MQGYAHTDFTVCCKLCIHMVIAWTASQPVVLTKLCLPRVLCPIWYVPSHCPHPTLPDCLPELPYELYMRDPLHTSRVFEAAMRTAQPISTLKPGSGDSIQLVQVILGSYHSAAEATSPEGAFPGAELMQNKRLASRSCSQLVSTLKALHRQLPLGIGQQDVMIFLLQLAASAAEVGPSVHSWAVGE